MRSSYIENNFGELLRTYVIGARTIPLVELGILDGYSTLHIAQGVRELQELYGLVTTFEAYDLFDSYEYKHGSQVEVQQLIDQNGLTDYVQIKKGNAFEVHKLYRDKSIEFLHVDISNTGDTLKKIMELWHPKIADKGILMFEGGSEERDNIEWMKKYNCPSIKQEIETNPVLNEFYMYGVYMRFPSMLVAMRKWWK
jgi:hypothetical protein